MFSSSSALPGANLEENTEWDHVNQHCGWSKCAPNNHQRSLKSCTNAIFHDYLAVAHLCWSCWSGSMCCQWRPPSVGDTPLTPSTLPHLGSLTPGSRQCVWRLPHFSASLCRVHQRSNATCCQSCHANTASCLELRQPPDQGTPTPPGDNTDSEWNTIIQTKTRGQKIYVSKRCFYNVVIYIWINLGSTERVR